MTADRQAIWDREAELGALRVRPDRDEIDCACSYPPCERGAHSLSCWIGQRPCGNRNSSPPSDIREGDGPR